VPDQFLIKQTVSQAPVKFFDISIQFLIQLRGRRQLLSVQSFFINQKLLGHVFVAIKFPDTKQVINKQEVSGILG